MNKTDDILNRLQQARQPRLDNPDELTERVMSRLPERGRPRPQSWRAGGVASLAGGGARAPKRHRRWLYAVVGIAASVLLLIGVGVITLQRKDTPMELIADNAQKENHPVKSVPDDAEKENHPVESVPDDAEMEYHPVESVPDDAEKEYHLVKSVPDDAEKENYPAKSVPDDAEKENHPGVKALDTNIHYAAYTETKDTPDGARASSPADPLPPARMDEFIEKLAAYHHIKATVLSDSTAHSVAYVFPDNDKVRLFDRLLQVACTYSYDSPGYQMTISQQQLLFTLEDTQLSRRYLWLAERIGGSRIILYATHAPTGAAVSSEAYQEFRERTTHTNQTTEL